jgi:hypothetical protein
MPHSLNGAHYRHGGLLGGAYDHHHGFCSVTKGPFSAYEASALAVNTFIMLIDGALSH